MKTVQYVIIYVVRPSETGHQVLLGLRAEGRYMGGTWQLITGGIEPNETAVQAAVREVGEETGLPVRELYRLSPVTQFYRADLDAICVAPMFCVLTDANAEPTMCPEHTSLQWVNVTDAGDRLMWPTDLAALSQLRTEILGSGRTKAYLRIEL